MATYYARKAGNINAADVWATTPTGTASNLFPTFTNADVLMANSFTVTVNVSTTVAEVRNDTTGGATAGGTFSLSEGVILTANSFTGANIACISITGAVSASVVGNINASQLVIVNGAGISHTSLGTLTVTGNINASTTPGGQANHGVFFNIAGTGGLNVTGNVTGGAQGTGTGTNGICVNNVGTVTVTGNVTGGTHSTGAGISNAAGTITVNGQGRGGTQTSGVVNNSTGTIRLTRAVGNAFGPGNTAGLAAAVGAANVGLGVIEIEQIEYGTNGMSPTSGTGIRLKKANTNVAVFNFCDTAGSKTLIDATANAAMPAASNVRSGVSYASGAATGSCAVPAASSVAFGVPVDATTGTALLTGAAVATAVWGAATRTLTAGAGISASDVWDYATRSLTTSSGPTAVQIRQEMDSNSTKLANLDATVSSRLAPSGTLATVTTLTNAPIVPTPSQIASQVRTELSVELNRVDQAISSRATPANIPAADITAIKAKTDAINVDRINNTATTAIVGNLLAQANS